MLNVKHIFKKVFIFILVFELILMLIIILRYIQKAGNIIESIDEQRKIMNIISKDVNFEYLNKKIQLIIEDEFLILRTLETIITTIYNQDILLNDETNFPKADSEFDSKKKEPWYIKNSWEEIEKLDILKLFYYPPNPNIENEMLIKFTRLIQPLLKKLIKKYYSWKDKIYVNLEYIHITYSTGLFLKYPFYPYDYSKGFKNTYNNNCQYLNSPNVDSYEPRCREFFLRVEEEKITFTKPYKFPNGLYGTDICIKSNKVFKYTKDSITNDFYFVVCYSINFYDYSVFKRLKIENLLNSETEYFITYISESVNELKVVYNSNTFLSSLKCNIENSNYDCEPVDFLNVFFKKELNSLFSILSKNNTKDLSDIDKQYIHNYEQLRNSSQYQLILNTIQNKTFPNRREILQLTPSNSNSNSYFYCSFQDEITINSDNNFSFNPKGEYKEIIYIFPITIGFTYNNPTININITNNINTFNVEMSNIDNNYTLTIDPFVFNYYLIIREKRASAEKTKRNFMLFIISEVVLFFFYLLCFNFLVWFIFNFFYYYISKGFLYPLKIILKLYLQIIEKSYNSKNKDQVQLNLNSELKIKEFNNTSNKKQEKKNCINYLHNFWSDIVIKKITQLSQIENHIEIQQTLTTLKAIILILEFNNSNDNYKKYSKYSTSMPLFIESIKYLSECFYSKYTDKERINYYLIKLMVENILMSMLQEFKNQKKIIEKTIKKNKEEVNKLINILSNIDSYHFISKKSIGRARNELENVIKNSSQDDIVESSKNDLYLLSCLEENINYMYAVHKCMLFEDFLMNQYETRSNIGNNIDEEEKNFLKKLQKREKKKQSYLSNINNDTINTNINNDNTINTNININSEKHTIFLNKNKTKNEKVKEKKHVLEKKNKVTINFIKTDDFYIISEDTKKYLESLISYCEDYLDLKIRNKKELKRIINKNAQTTIITSTNNIFSNFKSGFEDENSMDSRSNKMIEIFKEISILFFISKFYILIDEEQNGVANYENALNKLKKFDNRIEKIKTKLKENDYKTTNFTMLIVNSFFYEKLTFIFSMLCNKFYQSKTEIFINLNILDLSPIYSRSIRKIIITKLLAYTIKYRNELISKFDNSLNNYRSLITDNDYINIQHSIYKLISIRNITAQNIKKNILFVFDLGNKYIKDSVFKELLFNYFKKHEKENILNTFQYYFTAFDHKLYLQFEPSFEEEITLNRKYDKNYLKTISKNKKKNLTIQDNSNQLDISTTQEKESQNLKNDKINDFFDFINEYNEEKKAEHRTDKAIYHAALFGMYDESKNNNNNNYSNFNYRIKNNYKINEVNYMIVMTNLSSIFNNNVKNWKEITDLIYEKKMTVIVLLSYDPNLENEESLKQKICFYKKVLKSGMIDGHLFIMRSLTILKFVLNAIFPTKFSEFNSDIIKHYLCNVENINISKDIKN